MNRMLRFRHEDRKTRNFWIRVFVGIHSLICRALIRITTYKLRLVFSDLAINQYKYVVVILPTCSLFHYKVIALLYRTRQHSISIQGPVIEMKFLILPFSFLFSSTVVTAKPFAQENSGPVKPVLEGISASASSTCRITGDGVRYRTCASRSCPVS